eukprot:SAG11_NODE_20697_length_440_cov_0.739003_1_plen_23_part_10
MGTHLGTHGILGMQWSIRHQAYP